MIMIIIMINVFFSLQCMKDLTLSVDLGSALVEKDDLRLAFMLAKFFPVVPDMQWLLLVSVSV